MDHVCVEVLEDESISGLEVENILGKPLIKARRANKNWGSIILKQRSFLLKVARQHRERLGR